MTSFFIIKQGIGDIRFNSEQENVHCTVPHQIAEFRSLYVLFNVQRLLVRGTFLANNLINIKTSYNIIKDKNQKQLI